jgi:hypothetical protein
MIAAERVTDIEPVALSAGPPTLTPSEIARRLEEAFDTLALLPADRPGGYVSNWPDIVRSFNEAYGYEAVHVKRGAPSPRSIDQMDEAMQWLNLLRADKRPLVAICAGRAKRIPWRALAKRHHKHPKTIQSWWIDALAIIWATADQK